MLRKKNIENHNKKKDNGKKQTKLGLKQKCPHIELKQGRIHGNPVADSWAGAVMRKLLGIQKCDGWTDKPTYQPTWQGVVACPQTKNKQKHTKDRCPVSNCHTLTNGLIDEHRLCNVQS